MSLTRQARGMSAPVVRRGLTEDLFDGFGRFFDELSPMRVDNGGFGMDLFETEDALVLELAVPGLTAEAIDVSVEGRQLTVRADLPNGTDHADRRYWLRSIPRGTFTRNVRLPATVDTDAIQAQVQHGLLSLRMPKVAEAKTRKIEIANA